MEKLSPKSFSTVSRLADWCMASISQFANWCRPSLSRFADWCKAWTLRREWISDADNVSRWLFRPHMGHDVANLIWDHVFLFPPSRGYRESIVWRKYASDINDVHRLGCEDQWRRRQAGRNHTYFGCATARVGDIRQFKNPNNHGFCVIHEPSEGIHHAEVRIDLARGKKLTRKDRSELRFALKKIFDTKDTHSCPEKE